MTLDTDTKVQVINNLTSSSTTAALSANQGRLLNSSVSNGKTQVANAITDKGVAASGSDSFATLANKIRNLPTMTAIEEAWCATMDNYFWIPEIGMCWRDITLTISPDPYINGTKFTSENLQVDSSVINGPYNRMVISNGNYPDFCTIELDPPSEKGTDALSSTMTFRVSDGGYDSYFTSRSVSTSFNNSRKELSYTFYVTEYNGKNTGNSNRATLTIGFAGLEVPVSYWTRTPEAGNDEYKIGSMLGNMDDYNFTAVLR